MKIEYGTVFGFMPAFSAMRNPMDSWGESDSTFWKHDSYESEFLRRYPELHVPEIPDIGPKDLDLACKLIKRGSEHRKFLRQIMIWVNFTLPRYVWQELDTYKVATVRNSCSTMNKLGSRDLIQGDFQQPISESSLEDLNVLVRTLRNAKQESGDVKAARGKLKNDLPEGFLQMASYMFNYETALSVLLQRSNHRLPEWNIDFGDSLCNWIIKLPYMNVFYESATWKKKELRSIISELKNITINAEDDVVRERLSNIIERLKKTV